MPQARSSAEAISKGWAQESSRAKHKRHTDRHSDAREHRQGAAAEEEGHYQQQVHVAATRRVAKTYAKNS
jgi:hypothetical protein